MVTWFPLLVTLVVAGIVVGVMVNINALIGPKRVSAVKMEAFECGNPPSGSAWGRFSVRGRIAKARDVRLHRGAHLYRDLVRRTDLRMGARRARLGLGLDAYRQAEGKIR
jgi:hypothetical protein